MLTLSQRERDRLVILRQVRDGTISVSEGARRLRLDRRHFRRLLRRFEQEGDRAVVHRSRGRRPNNAKDDALRARVLETARAPLYHDFGPTLLAEHLARDPQIGVVHPHTLRRWLIAAQVWVPTQQGKRHRRRRERRSAFGELVLMDTSIHRWLEERSTEEIVLIALIDDATSRLYARFFRRDTGAANRHLLVDYLSRYGRMGALYTDRAGHFQAHFRAKERKATDQPEALTLIRRALDALDVELILALSPQAKGRVERLFKTLQDRLLKELRVAGVSSLEGANRFLDEVFLPFWNARFTVEPATAADAHRPLPDRTDLLRLFAETEERVIRADFTFRYRNTHYQIERSEAEAAMPSTCVTIEQRVDGTTRWRWRECYLSPTPLSALPRPASPPEPSPPEPTVPRPLSGAAGKPVPPNHPWRRFPVRVGRGRGLPRAPSPVVASAPAALRPDTPAGVTAGSTST